MSVTKKHGYMKIHIKSKAEIHKTGNSLLLVWENKENSGLSWYGRVTNRRIYDYETKVIPTDFIASRGSGSALSLVWETLDYS